MAVRPDATTKSAASKPAKAEDDLEQYGVWVKAEPQDIVEEPESVQLERSGVAEESFLTEDEEKLLGSFEELDQVENQSLSFPEEGSYSFDPNEGDTMSEIPAMENLPSLEDFEIKDEFASDVEDLGASTIDISLEDLDTHLDAPSPIRPDASIDMKSIKGLGDGPAPSSPSTPSIIEDVSAEFLDFEDSPSSVESESSDVTSEFLDAEPLADQKSSPSRNEPDFEPIDMDLHFDDTIGHENGKTGMQEPGFEAVSEFDDFLTATESPLPEPVAAGSGPGANSVGFDDLAAVEEDLAMPVSKSERSRPTEHRSDNSLSNELLQKIAEELSSIRGELVTLKSQIVSLKDDEKRSPPQYEEAPEPIIAAPAGGFFDDEEDETIALTGDELDNILNTADFTEENIAEAGAPMDIDLGMDSISDDLILPENGDYRTQKEEPAIEEIHLETSELLPELGEEEMPASPIDLLAEDEFTPMTQAPDDTSYLEEPLAEEVPLELDEIPLHEESILGTESFTFDMEEAEPVGLESEELPVVTEGKGFEDEAFGDLTLGMQAEADYMPETVHETEPLEFVPEEEGSSFEEISLTEESLEPLEEDIEELGFDEVDLGSEPADEASHADLESDIEEKTVKPAQPVSFHPDEIPMSLDDSFFVETPPESPKGAPKAQAKAVPEQEKKAAKPAEEEFPDEAGYKEAAVTGEAGPAEAPEGEGDDQLKSEIKGVLSYLDKLLESLPEDKIEEFARSEYFDTYKKIFEELGLV